MEELKEGWRKVKLGEIVEYVARGITPKYTEEKESILVINQKCIRNMVLNLELAKKHDLSKKISKDKILKKYDILINSTGVGTLGRVCQNFNDTLLTVDSHVTILRADSQKINPLYLGYAIKNKEKLIESLGEGSTGQTELKKDILLERIQIDYPQNSFLQKKIVSILSSLDEKIELNRKINQNLEEICQNYFVEIFIKNSNKNCSIGQISDLGNIVSGATPSKKNQKYYTNFGIPWITPKDLSKISNKFISRGNLDITELGFKNSSVRLLPKGSVLFSSRAPIGYIAICNNDVTTNQGFKSIVPFKNIGTEFVYYFLKNNVQFLESRASGSTFKEISTTIMATTPAIIPKEEPLKVFKKICVNIFEKQYIIEKETEKLIELRDYLLPRLMSGEIDISNLKISEISNSDLSFYLIQFYHLKMIKLKLSFLAIVNYGF